MRCKWKRLTSAYQTVTRVSVIFRTNCNLNTAKNANLPAWKVITGIEAVVLPRFRGGCNIKLRELCKTDLCVNWNPEPFAYTKSLRNASTTIKIILSNCERGGAP